MRRSRRRPRTTSRTSSGSSTRSCSSSVSSRCSSARSSSSTPSRSSSPNAAGRWRCSAPSAPRADRSSGRCCSKPRSSVSSASIIGFVAGVLLAAALKAALAAFGIDIPASDITIPASAVIWSFIVGMLVTIVAAVFPAIRAVAHPADRRAPAGRRRPVRGFLEADRRAASSSRSSGSACCSSGLSGDGAIASVGLGAFVVFIGIAVLGPTIARPISAVLGWPIRGMKGITGLLAEENAKRNPKRTSATAAALMIGVALVGLIIVFGASARASVRAGIDQSMKADYIVTSGGFGLRHRSRACSRRSSRETPGVEQASGTQFGPIKVGTGVSNALGRGSGGRRLPVRPRGLGRVVAGAGGRRHRPCRSRRPRTRAGRSATTSRCSSRPVRPKTFTIQAIFDQNRVPQIPEYVISTEAFVANYPNVFDAADLRPDRRAGRAPRTAPRSTRR